MTVVFLLGATGNIGGSVLVSLREAYPDITINALVRSEAVFPAIKAAGANPVKGSFSDHELIASLAAQADIVINAADSDDTGLLTAILSGLTKRKEEGRGIGSFIHTSGAMIFIDCNKEGKYDPNAKVWTDSEEDIKSLTPSMFHGQVDIPLMKASEEGCVNSFIINPTLVFGSGTGPVSQTSAFMRICVGPFVQRKEVVYVGEGSNAFGFIHTQDLTLLYLAIFKLAISTDSKLLNSSPYSRYYIANSGTAEWKTVVSGFAVELHKRGRVTSPVPKSIPFADMGPFAIAWSSNMLVRVERAKSLGWEPKHKGIDAIFDGLDECLSTM